MNEIKNPKRPLVYYAVVAMLAVLLFGADGIVTGLL